MSLQIENQWIPKDYGIDPEGGIFDKPRINQEFDKSPGWITCLADSIFCLTLPLSACCAVKKVKPMTDSVVSRCGIVTQILREPGPYCINPCCTDTTDVYMGLDDIEIKHMGANDSHGSPLVVSAQFVYRVTDSVSASYKTTDLAKFLKEQAESGLRGVLAQYPYDVEGHDQNSECLRKHSKHLDDHFKKALQAMVNFVGVKIESFRLINIGYDPKMEKLLLARQEAQAEVTARTTIAEGASGIIQETLTRLRTLGIRLTEREQNKFAVNLTMILVNHGHTTLNLFEEGAPSAPVMQLPLALNQGQAKT